MKIIGLTGGIASGKSIISSWFIKEGIPVIDADFVYKQLSKPFEVLYNEIVNNFPDVSLNPDKSINWHKLGEKVYADEQFRKQLNELTHPVVQQVIIQEIEEYEHQNQPILVVSVPLLFEANFDKICDKTIVVYIDRKQQISRLMKRDSIEKDFAISKIDAQMSMEEKAAKADFVIDNAGTMQNTLKEFQRVLTIIRSE